MKVKLLIVGIAVTSVFGSIAKAQLTISSGAVFNIQSSAFVTVQGDVLSNADITGAGSLILKGSANQNVNMNGFTVPNLEMDNAANATLTGNLKIGTSVKFTNGKILLGSNTATLTAAATSTGMGTSKFFETDGSGFVRREIAADISNLISPVGVGTDYLPVSLTNTGSAYAGASIGVQAKGVADANKHPRTETYLLANWPINKIGITGGTTNAVGTYVDPTRFVSFGSGVETDLRGFYWDGTNWSLTGGSQDATLNTVGANISSTNGELFGMNKFVLLNTKIFLQAAYNTLTPGLMDDKLRTTVGYVAGNPPTGNLIPSSDPYRTATYSTNFAHVANSAPEIVTSGSVFNDQLNPNKNIVDWVFLELRSNVAAPTTVLQTRSALLLRDGSIVDIDGLSPIYFKNTDLANTLNLFVSARHRNHLGLRSLTTKTLDIFSNPVSLDLSNNANTLSSFGATLGAGVNGLYAGNVNLNNNIRVTGASALLSDFESLKVIIGSLPLINNSYSAGDANMNRIVRITGASTTLSDFEYIKSIIGSLPLINQPTY